MDKIAEVLQALAEKLGTTVEELGPHVMRHVQVRAGAAIGAVLLALVGTAILFGLSVRSGIKNGWFTTEKGYHDTPSIVGPKLSFIMTLIGGVAFMVAIPLCLVTLAKELPHFVEPLGGTVRILLGR